ncbi:MAG: RCC1 repeat-containing protein [Actinomycetia bacterium]|nr:RCC1 repeat-containing protein [Actinomycetes bacterium]
MLKADGTLWSFGFNGYGELGTPTNNNTGEPNPAPTQVLADVTAVASGSEHSLALKSDGSLWTFGANRYGQLGSATNSGTATPNPNPAQVLVGVIAIAGGERHTLALKADGTLWTFGSNDSGQLGTATNSGNANPNPTPTQVLSGVTAIAAGARHSLALKSDGTLWAFGANDFGQLGTATNSGTNSPTSTPTQVLSGVRAIAAGGSHSLVLKTDGTLWSFGINRFGELGYSDNNGTNVPNPSPTQVMSGVNAIAAGGGHSLALKSDGTLWTFGYNSDGELGNSTNNQTDLANPVPTQVLTGVVEIAAGTVHSLALKSNGKLFAFGRNQFGQLGTATNSGTITPTPTPTEVFSTDPPGIRLPSPIIAAGGFSSFVVGADGRLWSFGQNETGQLGTSLNLATFRANPAPTVVMADVVAVASSGEHTLAVKADGTLWTFGYNFHGQLGTTVNSGTGNANPVPTQVMTGVVAVAAGHDHSLALKADGTLWAFGSNTRGQLGTPTNTGLPMQVMTDVVGIAAGADHSVALKADGTVWTFGLNDNGQLGHTTNMGTLFANPTPTQVLSDVKAIAAGSGHTLAIKNDGTLVAFGAGGFGYTTPVAPYANPVPTTILTNVTAVSVSSVHGLAVKSDGTLWAFGSNQYGQWGTTVNLGSENVTPTQVSTGVTAIATGAGHSMVVKSDGTLWSFGLNRFGQLGVSDNNFTMDANPIPKFVPLRFDVGVVTPTPGRLTIAAGFVHSLVLRSDGSVWTFGANRYGQLGTSVNNFSDEPNPTPTQLLEGVVAVASGGSSDLDGAGSQSLALKSDGTLWAFGLNQSGEVGTSTNTGTTIPTPPTMVLSGVAAIAAGGAHSLALKTDGTLWSFGLNASGQLGTADHSSFDSPSNQAFLSSPTQVLSGVVEIAGGGAHSLALKSDGTLWSFGENAFGQLGTTTNVGTNLQNPVPMKVLSGVTAIAAGRHHSLALKSDGTLWTFGENDFGQLGTATNSGTTNPNSVPTQVMTGVASIAAGANHSLVVKTDGTLWSFGRNTDGQLGTASFNGTDTASPVPTQVLSQVIEVVGGGMHTLAVKTDGTLWAFGSNTFGQLGVSTNVGTSNPNPVPTQVLDGLYPLTVGTFKSFAPGRLLDSRPTGITIDGQFQAIGVRGAGSITELKVAGRGGVPGNAAAVALNVTVTAAQDGGYATVYPCGAPPPNASNLNFGADGTIPNLVIAQIGTGGKVCIFTSAATHLLVDVNGFYPAGSTFASLVPGRLLDSRPTGVTVDGQFQAIGVRPAGSITELQVTGRGGVPGDAAAVVLNVTVTAAQGGGYATVYPCGSPPPNASNLNYNPGDTIPNLVITKIGNGGKVCIFTSAGIHLLADVNGFYPIGSTFTSLVPGRLLDSRPTGVTVDGQFQAIGVRAAGSITELLVDGRGGVPSGAVAVVLNVTVTGAQDGGYVTVYPCGSPPPNASNLNFSAGDTIPNSVITKIGTGGKVCIFTSAGIHLLADVNGYYSA